MVLRTAATFLLLVFATTTTTITVATTRHHYPCHCDGDYFCSSCYHHHHHHHDYYYYYCYYYYFYNYFYYYFHYYFYYLLLATPPPYPLPLLHTLLRHIRFTRYLQHFRHVGTSYEASNFTCEFSNSSIRFWTCFWGGGRGVCGKNDDDIVTPTPRTTSPEEPFYSVFTVLS